MAKLHPYTMLRSTVSAVQFRLRACATFGEPFSSGWETASLQGSLAEHPTNIQKDIKPAVLSNSSPLEQDKS